MATKEIVGIGLSDEELLFLLGKMGGESLIGFDANHFDSLSENELNVAMRVAERALVARGFIHLIKGKSSVAPLVFSLVGACAAPETTLVISRNMPDLPKAEYYFHTSRKMIVLHTLVIAGIHQFLAFDNKEAMARSIFSIMALPDLPKQQEGSAIVKPDDFIQARKLALEGNMDKANKVLSERGVEPEISQELANTLAHPIANTTLAYITNQDGDQTADGFSVLQGEMNMWTLIPIEKENPKSDLKVTPVSSVEITALTKNLLHL